MIGCTLEDLELVPQVGQEYFMVLQPDLMQDLQQCYIDVNLIQKLKVTYYRSGVFFYTFVDYPTYPEGAFFETSWLALSLIPVEINVTELNRLRGTSFTAADFDNFNNRVRVV